MRVRGACGTASPCASLATESGPACSRERSRGGDVVSFNLNRLRSGEELFTSLVKGRPRRSSLSFSGTLLTHRGFNQDCVVSCDACVAAPVNGRRAQTVPRRSGGSSPSHAIAVNAATTASTAAFHITRRYASTTATDARADADVLPEANPSAATATGPPSLAAALFTTDAEPPRSLGAASRPPS